MVHPYTVYFIPDAPPEGECEVMYAKLFCTAPTREEAVAAVRSELDQQWVDEREYYGDVYQLGVAALERYATHTISALAVAVEYGELLLVSPHAARCMAVASA